MTQSTSSLCYLCKLDKPIVLIDDRTGFGYCEGCSPLSTPHRQKEFLSSFLATTIPYFPGDRVECRTAGVWLDGIGTIDDIDLELKHGGTPVCPTFHVTITDPVNENSPTEAWYTEICLRKVQDQTI